MASDGPVKLTSGELRKFQAILKLPAGAEKTKQIQALTATEKDNFRAYTDYVKQKQLVKKLETLQDRQQELSALEVREEDLVRQDKSLLTQASSSYAPKVGAVQTRAPTSSSTPKYGSKFSQ